MKIESRNTLLQNDRFILESVRNLIRSSELNEEVTLEGTATPDFKEGMVVYFSALPIDLLSSIENKLSTPDKKIQLTLPKPADKSNYGEKSYGLVKTAIKKLSKNIISDLKEIELFANALSIAKYIQSLYGKPVQADRGDVFKKIRDYAVLRVQDVEPKFAKFADKWCPADIYIYNNRESVSKVLSAKTLKIGDDCLNAQFQSDLKNTNQGILAISLKEEKAQGGAGGSFDRILTRKENYNKTKTIKNYSVYRFAYHYRKLTDENLNKKPGIVGPISTAHAFAMNLEKQGISGADVVARELQKTLEINLGKKELKSKIKPKTKTYDASDVISLANEKGLKKVILSNNLRSSVEILFKNSMKKISKEYTETRNNFINDLKDSGIAVNLPPANVNLPVEYMLGKAGCYKAASFILNGLNAKILEIPKEFKTIMQQKNPFVALTAYAIGQAGISPTFFKFTGSSKIGGSIHVDTFYSDGFLNLDKKSEIKVNDSDDRMGFSVEFVTNMTLENSSKSSVLKKYKVTINFQSGGDSVSINVQEFKSK